MLSIIIKLIISIGLPSIMVASLSRTDPKYDIINNPSRELILLFILFVLAIYLACFMIQLFMKLTNSVIVGFFTGGFVGTFIWCGGCIVIMLIFWLFGVSPDMFTDDYPDNQCLAVTILDALLLIPLGIDIGRVIKYR